ncbi:hypothetical protein MBOL_24030 [Mycobacteroides abscessus subsp. bolletii BD]|nr:hypothetical protein MBOL_24030 [Mycobacteroides abscessus subsp. bolletii BD]
MQSIAWMVDSEVNDVWVQNPSIPRIFDVYLSVIWPRLGN